MTDESSPTEELLATMQAIASRRRNVDDPHTEDYLSLPELGAHHYSVRDAALLIAIDAWTDGRLPDLTSEALWDASEPDRPEVRQALAPVVEKHAEVLMRSHRSGVLEAEVRARSWPDLEPDPARTYVDVFHLRDWLDLHGQPMGDFLYEVAKDFGDELWDAASVIARQRAQFRTPIKLPDSGSGPDFARVLRQQLEAAYRRIAELEGRGSESSGTHAATRRDLDLKTRPRRTLLAIIAALCRKCGIDIATRGAAASIASITDEAGTPVSDDTIRALLREMAAR